eukprot:1783840-Rhodomonas_salina.2
MEDPCGQSPVDLGAAEHYSVLAGSTITNTLISSIIGDVGVSPGTAITNLVGMVVAGDDHIHSANEASAAGIVALSETPMPASPAQGHFLTALPSSLQHNTLQDSACGCSALPTSNRFVC